jgi:hypothetical protein
MNTQTNQDVTLATKETRTIIEDKEQNKRHESSGKQLTITGQKSARSEWIIGLLSGVIGSVMGAVATIYTVDWQVGVQNKLAEVNLTRDLVKDFSTNAKYVDVSTAIESCKALFDGYGGKFNYRQMNLYLDFFEDLGFYLRQGVLRLETIDHNFGAHIIEAYEDAHVKKYLHELRTKASQKLAYAEFEYMARQLEALQDRKEWVAQVQTECTQHKR